jgi:predicted metalloprotease with PDZ domain
MYAFHVDVPRGARTLDVAFEFLSATTSEQGRVAATPSMLNLQWFHLALYPAGRYARRISIRPSVLIPDDWSFTTQLPLTAREGQMLQFADVDLEVLMDSPIFAGRHFRRFELGAVHGAPVSLDVIADRPEFLEAAPEAIEAHRRLVDQAGRVFGAPPFQDYRFMLALTEEMGSIGTEHLSSSEITQSPDYLTGSRPSALLPHEFVHAWNGKARRPRELWSADFNQPMRNALIWVYEGQTQFWALMLAGRCGLMTPEQILDVYARLAAIHMEQPGRTWRPLADTSNDLIITRELLDEPWPSWRREGGNAYTEAALMWLEADGVIRELSGEQRGLDDFARQFFAGGGQRPSLYDFDDIVAALNRVQPYDWRAFFDQRLNEVAPVAPTTWLSRSGYRLAFDAAPTPAFVAHHSRGNRVDLQHSLGLILKAGERGEVLHVIWNGPAFEAGLTPGAVILEVQGAPYTAERLFAAIEANHGGGHPIALKIEARRRERTVTIDYRGGLRFPRLERAADTTDRLGALLAPRS